MSQVCMSIIVYDGALSRIKNAMKLERDMNYIPLIRPMSGLINLYCQISCWNQTRLELYLVIKIVSSEYLISTNAEYL